MHTVDSLNLDELPPKSALDTEIALRHGVIQRRSHTHDIAILLVNRERASHAAVGTNGVGMSLAGFVPGAGLAHIVFALEHQRSRGADADAVPTVNACGFGQGNIVFGGDVSRKAASGDGDRERILRIHAARLHALVAEDAL